jgi:hypothetical protein
MESLTDDCKEPFCGPHKQAYAVKWEDADGTVHDYTGLYELRIDDKGQFYMWSLPKQGSVAGIKINPNPSGQVALYKVGLKRRHFYLWRVWTFVVIGLPPSDGQVYTVDHIDQNRQNNSTYNMRWATPSQQNANRKKFKRTIKKVPLTDDEMLLERRQLGGRYFILSGYEVYNTKNGWMKAVDRQLTKDGYIHCKMGRKHRGMNRIVTHLFGGDDDIYLDDIDDDTVIIEHLDDDKTNNHKNNLRVSTQKKNVESWHASGKSTKKRVYAMSKEDETDLREFDSAADASRKIPRASPQNIGTACKKTHLTAGGFYWSHQPFD